MKTKNSKYNIAPNPSIISLEVSRSLCIFALILLSLLLPVIFNINIIDSHPSLLFFIARSEMKSFLHAFPFNVNSFLIFTSFETIQRATQKPPLGVSSVFVNTSGEVEVISTMIILPIDDTKVGIVVKFQEDEVIFWQLVDHLQSRVPPIEDDVGYLRPQLSGSHRISRSD